jgi:hypothetical protein
VLFAASQIDKLRSCLPIRPWTRSDRAVRMGRLVRNTAAPRTGLGFVRGTKEQLPTLGLNLCVLPEISAANRMFQLVPSGFLGGRSLGRLDEPNGKARWLVIL